MKRTLRLFALCVLAGCTSGRIAPKSPQPGSFGPQSNCQWSVESSPNRHPTRLYNVLTDVAVAANDDVWAVGSTYTGEEGGPQRALLEHWDGNGWRIVPFHVTGTNVVLYGIDAVSPNDVWVVGSIDDRYGNGPKGLIEHWGGKTWRVVPASDPGSRFWHFEQVSAVGPNDVWAVGNTATGHSGGTLIEHWDGKRWSLVPSPNVAPRPLTGLSYPGLSAVSALASNDVWAGGEAANVSPVGASNTLVEHWDGAHWSITPSPDASVSDVPFDHLFSVAAIASNDVWAVGSYGTGPGYGGGGDRSLIEHWDGLHWTISSRPNVARRDGLAAITAVFSGDVWAVGGSGIGPTAETLIERWNGKGWSVVPGPPGSLYGVAAAPSGDVWAVGAHQRKSMILRCAASGAVSVVPDKSTPAAGLIVFPITGRVLAATEHRGSLWVLTCDHRCSGRSSIGRLQRLDPTTGRVGAMVQLRAPSGLAVDDTGEWVFNIYDGTVTHLDTAGNVLSVTQLELPTPIAGDTAFLPEAIAVGEGAVWVPSDTGELARLDPSTGAVEQYIPLPPDAFGGNLVTGFGSVWIPEQLLGVAQLDPATNQVITTVPITQNGLTLSTSEVAVAGGELWVSGPWSQPVTDEGGNTSLELIESWAVASIDPTTGQVTSIRSFATPSALVAGAGRLWVVNSRGVPTWQVHGARLAHFSGLRGRLVAVGSDRVWVLTRSRVITARSTAF